MKDFVTSVKFRRYLYTVAASAGPLLIMLGVIGPEEYQVLMAVLGAVLALGAGATAVHYTGGQYTTHRVDPAGGYDPETDA